MLEDIFKYKYHWLVIIVLTGVSIEFLFNFVLGILSEFLGILSELVVCFIIMPFVEEQ
jgi:hypothetical protein